MDSLANNAAPDYKALYEAKCAEAEKMRGASRKAYFALMEWDAPIQDTRILNLLREMYEVCSHAEAGKPLLDKMVELRQQNLRMRNELRDLKITETETSWNGRQIQCQYCGAVSLTFLLKHADTCILFEKEAINE